MTEKIIIYYTFTPLSDPEAIKLWQKTLGEGLHLRGRVLISKHGINGTVGGEIDNVKAYVKAMKSYEPFKKTVFKWSDGSREAFPRMSVKVRDEIVAFDAADELKVDENGVVGGGTHLKPEAVHKLVEERGDEVIFFDGRNAYEAQVGKFKNAIVPNTRTTRDFKKELESGKYDDIKDKPVVTYCTAGVRCEILSSLMKNRGFKEVYQIDGGIVKYGEKYKDGGLWEGSLYIFDGRMNHRFSENARDIGKCVHCHSNTSNYENCALKSCNNLVLICETCHQATDTCSEVCEQALARVAA
ncbi:MAG TPA: rhodanese-related sulfurtransferase [Candidatus Saccharimonadales bacterium]